MIHNNIDKIYHALDLRDPELSIVLTDNPHIHQLNKTWLGEDRPTDVLSFPLYEGDELSDDIVALGDIVISIEYAENLLQGMEHKQRVAAELGVDPATLEWSLVHEIAFLLIHGMLHLVGYDHADDEEEAEMKSEEKRLWEAISSSISQP